MKNTKRVEELNKHINSISYHTSFAFPLFFIEAFPSKTSGFFSGNDNNKYENEEVLIEASNDVLSRYSFLRFKVTSKY